MQLPDHARLSLCGGLTTFYFPHRHWSFFGHKRVFEFQIIVLNICMVSEMAKSKEMTQSANVLAARVSARWQALTKALFDDYRPEVHYMRGPGPRWHEKHDRAEIGGVSPAVTRALAAGLRP